MAKKFGAYLTQLLLHTIYLQMLLVTLYLDLFNMLIVAGSSVNSTAGRIPIKACGIPLKQKML